MATNVNLPVVSVTIAVPAIGSPAVSVFLDTIELGIQVPSPYIPPAVDSGPGGGVTAQNMLQTTTIMPTPTITDGRPS